MMKKLLLSLAFSLALASSAMAAKVGDHVNVRFACKEKESIVAMALSTPDKIDDLGQTLIRTGSCAMANGPVAVTLKKEYHVTDTLSAWPIEEFPYFILADSTDEPS